MFTASKISSCSVPRSSSIRDRGGATSRSVYLPTGTWYDFWAGSTVTGGSKMMAAAPLSQMPLYVRAGSIVPMGPMIQYATQSIDPLEIRVYEGQDATFTLYEDEATPTPTRPASIRRSSSRGASRPSS